MTSQNAIRFLCRRSMQAAVASCQDKRYDDTQEAHGTEHPHVGKAVVIRRILTVAVILESEMTLKVIEVSRKLLRFDFVVFVGVLSEEKTLL